MNDIQPTQLEIPFMKSNFKNNYINEFYFDDIFMLNKNESREEWLDPYIPKASWDNRKLKKFLFRIWITDSYEENHICYATSIKVAKTYLEKNYFLADIYEMPEFPTDEINLEIAEKFKFYKEIEMGVCNVKEI